MSDELSLGATPRPRRRPSRRTVLVTGGAVVLVAAATTLLVISPWHTEPLVRLTATGQTCTVGYGTDLVVVTAQLTNPSRQVPVTITGIGLDPATTAVRRAGGAIDIVSGTGCDHLLALRGDQVTAGRSVWLGLTVRAGTCEPTTVPVVVTATGRAGSTTTTAVAVPLAADVAPVCTADGAPHLSAP